MKDFDRIAVLPEFAHTAIFEILKRAALRSVPSERITIPWHKRLRILAAAAARQESLISYPSYPPYPRNRRSSPGVRLTLIYRFWRAV